MKPLAILLHGWSDTAQSFIGMKAFLRANGINDLEEILFGEYESREDALTFHDIVDGFHEQLIERGIIARDGISRSVVPCSTALSSRVRSSWSSPSGTRLCRVRTSRQRRCSCRRWWAYGYSGLKAVVDKPGTDGTVVVAGMPLNSVRFQDCVQRAMTAEAHQNRTDSSGRRFLVEPRAVERILGEARQALGEAVSLVMRVLVPRVDSGVRYEAEASRAAELWPATGASPGRLSQGPVRSRVSLPLSPR